MNVFEKMPVYMFSYKTENFRTMRAMKENADSVIIICRQEESERLSELYPNNRQFILPEAVTDLISTFEYTFSKLVDAHDMFIVLDDDIRSFNLANSPVLGSEKTAIYDQSNTAFFKHVYEAVKEQLSKGNKISLFRPIPAAIIPAAFSNESSLNVDFTTMFYGVVSENLKAAMANVVWNLSRLGLDNNLVMNSLLCGFSCYAIPTARFSCMPLRPRSDEALDYKDNCQFVKYFEKYCRMIPATRSLHIWAKGMRVINSRKKLYTDSAHLYPEYFIERFANDNTLLKSELGYGYRFLEVV